MKQPLTIPEPLSADHYPCLDGLRGLAILLVLLPHFGINRYLYPTFGFNLDSTAGVQLFFCLSGFLITTLLLKEKAKHGKIALRAFYTRRCLRILPLAYLYLIVLALLNGLFRLHLPAADLLSAGAFINNLPISGSYYTAHFWTLAVEVQFYLLFPLLLAWDTDYYFITALLLVTLVPLTCCFPDLFGGGWVKLCLYAFWKGPIIILTGSVAALLVFKRLIRPKDVPFAGILLLLTALIVRNPHFLLYTKYAGEYLSALLFAAVIVFSLGQKGWLSAKLPVRAGLFSYSLYIWQQLFVGPNPWQPWLRGLQGLALWQLILLKVLLVFGIAFFSYRYERYFLRVKERWKPS